MLIGQDGGGPPLRLHAHVAGGDDSGEEADGTLEDAARGEREYVRERVREELGREPTEAEVDAWLREHTEGY